MKRLINSPLKTLGTIIIILGLISIFISKGFLIVIGAIIIVIGILPFMIDPFISRNEKWQTKQIVACVIYLLGITLLYLSSQSHNTIEFENPKTRSAAIVFGINGYPKLPNSKFWNRKITIPESGLLVTSTLENEISYTNKFKNADDLYKFTWDANFSYPCMTNNNYLKAWFFYKNTNEDMIEEISKLAEEECQKENSIHYSSSEGAIRSDNEGDYLFLQKKYINRIPAYVSKINVYKVNLSGNHFTTIPKEIIAIKNLEVLYVSKNKLDSIPEEISQLSKLRLLDISKNNVSHLPKALSRMENLETIYLKDNLISSFEIEEFKKQNPHIELR